MFNLNRALYIMRRGQGGLFTWSRTATASISFGPPNRFAVFSMLLMMLLLLLLLLLLWEASESSASSICFIVRIATVAVIGRRRRYANKFSI